MSLAPEKILPTKKVSTTHSFGHKLNRIRQQEMFRQRHRSQFGLLTKRELEVFSLLAKGCNNPEVADLLCISRTTVEQHRKNIKRKLEVRTYYHLFQYALAFDLV